jgi:hypothetical protein
MARRNQMLVSLVLVAWLGAAGLVIGFCLGGLLGPRLFGSKGGHGLGDLGYLFEGAILGCVAGAILGVRGVRVWTPQQQGRVAAWAGLAGVVIAGGTAVLVNVLHVW